MAANPDASACPIGCQPRAPAGLASITRASTVATTPIVLTRSALAVPGRTRSSIVSSRRSPAARSLAYQRVPSAMWLTASATVQSISGMGRVQSWPAGPSSAWQAGRLEHVPSLHGPILADPVDSRHRPDGAWS